MSASSRYFAFYFEVEPDFSIDHFHDFSLLVCEKISVLFFDSENMVITLASGQSLHSAGPTVGQLKRLKVENYENFDDSLWSR